MAARQTVNDGSGILDLANGAERSLQLQPGWTVWSLSWARDGKALSAAVQSTKYMIARNETAGKTRVLPDK
jgi:hypothetical protein